MEIFSNLKNRLAREYDEMSSFKKIAYSIGIVASIAVAVLLLSGVWEPFAVQSSTTVIPKK